MLLRLIRENAESFQPFEAGIRPIRDRIEYLSNSIPAIDFLLKFSDLSDKEKAFNAECLKLYVAEKKELEEYLETKRKLNATGLVQYLAVTNKNQCDLAYPHYQPR